VAERVAVADALALTGTDLPRDVRRAAREAVDLVRAC
jgi:hypothetical protein